MMTMTQDDSRQERPSGDGLPDEITVTARFSYYYGKGVERELRVAEPGDTLLKREFEPWDFNWFAYKGIMDRENILKAQREAEKIKATHPEIASGDDGAAVSGDIAALVRIVQAQQEIMQDNAAMMRDVMSEVANMTNAFRAIMTGNSEEEKPRRGRPPKG